MISLQDCHVHADVIDGPVLVLVHGTVVGGGELGAGAPARPLTRCWGLVDWQTDTTQTASGMRVVTCASEVYSAVVATFRRQAHRESEARAVAEAEVRGVLRAVEVLSRR